MRKLSGIFLLVIFLRAGVLVSICDGEVSREEVEAAAEKAEKAAVEFMQQSFKHRLQFFYSKQFYNAQDRAELLKLTSEATAELEEIYQSLLQKKKAIEDYKGEDWDVLYGQTGLWRKAVEDAHLSEWYKYQIDYYRAVSSKAKERDKLLEDIIAKCRSGEGMFAGEGARLLEGKCLAVMGEQVKADRIFGSVISGSERSDEIYFRAWILKLWISSSDIKGRTEKTAKELFVSKYKNDLEMNAELALAALRLGDDEVMKNVVDRWAESEELFGKILLADIDTTFNKDGASTKDIEKRSVYEVGLAVKATMREGAEDYTGLLETICGIEKFQGSVFLYAAGEAYKNTDPVRAIGYYLEAAKLKGTQNEIKFELNQVDIAKKAAEAGIRLVYNDKSKRKCVIEAINYYCSVADLEADEDFIYTCVKVLEECSQDGEAEKLLKKIAAGGGKLALRAQLDLILLKFEVADYDPSKAFGELKTFVYSKDIDSNKDVKIEAIKRYCILLLSKNSTSNDREVLEVSAGVTEDRELSGFRATAMGRLGMWEEAVSVLAKSIDPNDCGLGATVFWTLDSANGKIDEYLEALENKEGFINESGSLFEYCAGCSDEDEGKHLELMRAEWELAAGKADIYDVQKILRRHDDKSSAEYLRCTARLPMMKGDFEKGFEQWKYIQRSTRSGDISERQGWDWWQAKYFELWCYWKIEGTDGDKVRHAIEVLQNSYTEIPRFWSEKLEELKTDIR